MEKKYLALTLIFLATGSGIKAYRHSKVRIGPMEDPVFQAQDSLISETHPDSTVEDPSFVVGTSSPDSSISVALFSASSVSAPSVSKATFAGKVSLNHASPKELTAINGIGAKTAQAIIEYRKEHGPFRDLRDLLQVKGIGTKKFERMRPFLLL